MTANTITCEGLINDHCDVTVHYKLTFESTVVTDQYLTLAKFC